MMFSSCKPFGTNCNFFNSVRSSCHEHFKSCYKYIFLNNFTFKGVSFLQTFLTMCFSQFFFYQALELKTVPYLFLLREWFYYVIEKWLHSPSLYPLKSQGARNGHIHPWTQEEQRQMASEWRIGTWSSILSQSSRTEMFLSTSPLRSESHLCLLSESYMMEGVHGQENSVLSVTTFGEWACSGRKTALILALPLLADLLGEAMALPETQMCHSVSGDNHT